MKRIALVGICLLLAATTAGAGQRMHYGVPWDAVDWEKLCKNVKPLVYTNPTTGQTCPKIHPADPRWRKNNPPWQPRCAALAKRYERNIGDAAGCRMDFSAALTSRALFPESFNEPLSTWRKRYFGPWMER